MLFGDVNLELLKRVLDASVLQHEVTASNIANVNTPGYQRREVHFQDELRAALRAGRVPRALAVQPRVVLSPDPAMRLDGNNVDLEREYATLTKNAGLFNTVAQIVAMRLAAYRTAISGQTD